MKIPFLSRTSIALALCFLLAVPASPQSSYGNIGPSKGEVIGAIAGAAAVLGGVGYLIYHETHKHPTITGCLASSPDGLSLTNEKDWKVYALSGDLTTLNAGKRVSVKGRKKKDSTGKFSLQVEKLSKDLGACAATQP